jgi:hypothetical protein
LTYIRQSWQAAGYPPSPLKTPCSILWLEEKHVMHPNRRSILKRGGAALFGAGVLSRMETPALAQRAAARAVDCNCTHARWIAARRRNQRDSSGD